MIRNMTEGAIIAVCFLALAVMLFWVAMTPNGARLEDAMRKVGDQQVEIQHLKSENAELRAETKRAKEIKAILEQVKEFFEGS